MRGAASEAAPPRSQRNERFILAAGRDGEDSETALSTAFRVPRVGERATGRPCCGSSPRRSGSSASASRFLVIDRRVEIHDGNRMESTRTGTAWSPRVDSRRNAAQMPHRMRHLICARMAVECIGDSSWAGGPSSIGPYRISSPECAAHSRGNGMISASAGPDSGAAPASDHRCHRSARYAEAISWHRAPR